MRDTSLAEKFHHAKALVRCALRRFDPIALLDQESDLPLLNKFVQRCVETHSIELHDLLMLHDDELRLLFEKEQYRIQERVVLRRYLNLPENAIWLLWMTLKIGGTVVLVVSYRVGRAVASLQGASALAVGVGLAVYGQHAIRSAVARALRYFEQPQQQQHRSSDAAGSPLGRSGGGRFVREEDFVRIEKTAS